MNPGSFFGFGRGKVPLGMGRGLQLSLFYLLRWGADKVIDSFRCLRFFRSLVTSVVGWPAAQLTEHSVLPKKMIIVASLISGCLRIL